MCSKCTQKRNTELLPETVRNLKLMGKWLSLPEPRPNWVEYKG